MDPRIAIRVNAAPPAKDGAISVLNPNHSTHDRVQALRGAMKAQIGAHKRFENVNLKMVMHYERATSQADALNIMNGVADVVQRRCHFKAYRFEVWLIDDDRNIREIHYSEEPADKDSYEATIEPIADFP